MTTSTNETTNASVVVIGQGAAGLAAAYAIAKQGVQVVSLSKVRPGNATCTVYAGGGFTLAVGGMSPAEHREMTYKTGRGLSVPELLDTFATEGPSIVDFMEDAGVPFSVRRGGIGVKRNPAFPLLGGKPLTDALQAACAGLGVRFLHNTAAVRLLTGDKGIDGVECIDHSTGEVLTLRAGAVVLATGGGGTLFERTDNPQRITGDGYRLALDASCHLLDMEFVQFYPVGIDIPGGAHWFLDLAIIDHARLTGVDGREFLKEMLAKEGIESGRQANLLARDKSTVAIALESTKGPVLLHLEDVPRDVWESDRYLSSIGRMFPKSAPPWSGPVNVHPIEHYFPGGVAIGTHGETEIEGLFACGEVTGGVDGANRVGGNALTNCILFGRRAGEAAAAHAKGNTLRPVDLSRVGVGADHPRVALDLPAPKTAADYLKAWKSEDSGDGVAPEALRKSLREYSTKRLLPMRDDTSLKQGLAELGEMGNLLERQRARDSRDILLAIENLGLYHTALAVTHAALTRTESRGAHYRTDYPEEDSRWERHIYLKGNR